MFTEEEWALFTKHRMRAFGEQIRQIMEDPDWDNATFEEKIRTALAAQVQAYNDRKIAKLMKTARFANPTAALEDIQPHPDRDLTTDRLARLASLSWIEDPINILVIGPTGSGKSYICQALGIHAVRHLHSAKYWRMTDLADALQTEAKNEIMTQAINAEVLLIDDFLTIPIPEQALWELFKILDHRDHRAPTIVATQAPPEDWPDVFFDDLGANSMLNRLTHPSIRIHAGTANHRPTGPDNL